MWLNNKIPILTLWLMLFLVHATSCKKYLDKKSDNSLVVPNTVEDAQALLDLSLNYQTGPALGMASADEYFQLPADYNTLGERINYYTWTPYIDNFNGNNDWFANYKAVYYANLSLQTIEEIPKTAINTLPWNNVKGSALFLRAFSFLNLAWTYSKAYDENTADNDMGIPLKLIPDFNVPTVRSTVRQTYERIVSDAKESIQSLPDLPQYATRPSKAAAYGLLARTYLSMRKYDSALKYADRCLQIKNQLMDYNIPGGDVIDLNALVPFKRFNAETVYYNEFNRTPANLANPGDAKIDTLLFASYDTNDLRRVAFFLLDNGYMKFRGSYAQSAGFQFSGITTAEMYLTRAECYARAGNKDAALSDLNTVLIKRWKNTVPYPVITATDTTDAKNKILVERRKELLYRGLRWTDIKRLNKEGANIIQTRIVNGTQYTLQPNANYYALPIPIDIIRLTGIPQNP